MSPIGFDLNGNVLLKGEDYHWLMEQAERVEELETHLSINTNNMKQLQKEIERYKQALELYGDESRYEAEHGDLWNILVDGGKTAREALGVDKFETRQNRND